MEPLRVLIADDHPLFRHGIHALLDAEPDLEVVGEATTGEEAVAMAAALQPGTILIDFFAAPKPAAPPQAFPDLTEREREILDLIARGKSSAEIASQLVLSPNTVRNYVSNIFSKLQVADRAHAILLARDAGLG
jgi:DNA-binding NarL/FixJ family response regulator